MGRDFLESKQNLHREQLKMANSIGNLDSVEMTNLGLLGQ